MITASAVELINNLVFKPGWTIAAEDHTNRFEGCVVVKITYLAANSDRDNARNGFVDQVLPTARASFVLMVATCQTVEDLCRMILGLIARIDSHEAREFLRVRPTMWAPFHPHRDDGMKRWGDVQGDLTFGLS